MAAFASYVGVRAIEYKTGTKVIERLLRRRIGRREQAKYCYGNQDQAPDSGASVPLERGFQQGCFHCSDLTSANESAV